MNLNDFFLSKKDKNNINSWLKTFDKPLYVSGKTGIGKTILVNTILKDYTQVIIDTQSTDSVKGILEENNLTRLFFSPQNIEAIQRMIRYYVHKLTNGQIVSKQSPDELFVIMRSILLQYGNFLSSGIINEIKRLNSKVVTICAEKVSTEVSQYNHYIDDLQKLPTPLENPHYVNKNNFTYDISNLPK